MVEKSNGTRKLRKEPKMTGTGGTSMEERTLKIYVAKTLKDFLLSLFEQVDSSPLKQSLEYLSGKLWKHKLNFYVFD